jgi:hypothetical protein
MWRKDIVIAAIAGVIGLGAGCADSGEDGSVTTENNGDAEVSGSQGGDAGEKSPTIDTPTRIGFSPIDGATNVGSFTPRIILDNRNRPLEDSHVQAVKNGASLLEYPGMQEVPSTVQVERNEFDPRGNLKALAQVSVVPDNTPLPDGWYVIHLDESVLGNNEKLELGGNGGAHSSFNHGYGALFATHEAADIRVVQGCTQLGAKDQVDHVTVTLSEPATSGSDDLKEIFDVKHGGESIGEVVTRDTETQGHKEFLLEIPGIGVDEQLTVDMNSGLETIVGEKSVAVEPREVIFTPVHGFQLSEYCWLTSVENRAIDG